MVWNALHLMLTRGLSTVRWNNFPRVVDTTHMDNVGATLHTALFISYLERKETWKKIDKLYLIKKILFHSFASLILSDINSGTKDYIKRLDSDIFSDLYKGAYNRFLEYETLDFLRNDFVNTLEESEKKLEDKIFFSAKKYVGYFECRTNAKVFSEMYEVPLLWLKKELEALWESLQGLKHLLQNESYEKYVAHIYRLSFSMRWNQCQRTIPISVMSHKVIVTYLSYIIWMIGNENGENNDIANMLMRAIYHDVPEAITWDIITPTKKAVQGFEKLLEKVEKTMMDDYLFTYIPHEYQTELEPFILHPFEWSVWEKVKYADIFSAFLEAKTEKQVGNKSFHEKYQTLLGKISKINHPWVEFLQKETLFHFDAHL